MKLWKTRKPVPVEVEQPKERSYFEMVAAADATVSPMDTPLPTVTGPETAMKLATAYRCTDILSGSIASLPLQLKRKRNDVFMVDENNPVNYLLTVRPNERQTAYDLMRNAVIQMVNRGNAYIYPEYAEAELSSLTLLSPGSVSYDKFLNVYLVNDPVNYIHKTLDCDEIIHLRNMSLDGGYTGVSVIRYAANVMGLAAAADQQNAANFKPGNTYRGFVSGDVDSGVKGYVQYDETQLNNITERFRKELQSGKNITYLPGNNKFNQLSMSPADIQLLETKKFSVFDICRFYGVHPDKAFAGQSQNYKASEMSQVQYMTDTIQPRLRQIANEFFVKLIPRPVAMKYRIEFDIEQFYQTDLDTISNYNEKQIQYGLSTPNELRAKQGKAPVDGGDETFISCNVAPIGSEKIKGGEVKNSK